MFFTIVFIVGTALAGLSFVTLAAPGAWAYNFPKIGTEYMPPLDEGSILDMPVTVPRASVTEAADDLKARDALMRRFPEVEMIVGKAGRADTPTDPSPLEMVESVITLRPKEYWPRRKMRYSDAEHRPAVVLAALQKRGLIEPIDNETDRHALLDAATMNATPRFDEAMRELALQRFREFEAKLGPKLLREFAAELVRRWQQGRPTCSRRWRRRHRRLRPASWKRSLPRSSRPVRARRTSTGSSSGSPRSWRRRRRWSSARN